RRPAVFGLEDADAVAPARGPLDDAALDVLVPVHLARTDVDDAGVRGGDGDGGGGGDGEPGRDAVPGGVEAGAVGAPEAAAGRAEPDGRAAEGGAGDGERAAAVVRRAHGPPDVAAGGLAGRERPPLREGRREPPARGDAAG